MKVVALYPLNKETVPFLELSRGSDVQLQSRVARVTLAALVLLDSALQVACLVARLAREGEDATKDGPSDDVTDEALVVSREQRGNKAIVERCR